MALIFTLAQPESDVYLAKILKHVSKTVCLSIQGKIGILLKKNILPSVAFYREGPVCQYCKKSKIPNVLKITSLITLAINFVCCITDPSLLRALQSYYH